MNVRIKKYEFIVENDIPFWFNIDKWEQYSFNILDKILKPDSIFIDLGAWNGVLSMYASKIAKTVYAFEPDYVAFNNLQTNITLNKLTNIVCSNKAIGKCGIWNLYVRSFGDSVSSLIDRNMPNYKANQVVKVKTIKLSSYLLKNNIEPTLIKMDIEGGEIYVIEEMSQYIRKYTPTMLISFHPAWFPDKDNDINKIADILDKYYKILNITFLQYTKEQFINSLYSTEHCFLFIKK